MGQMQNSEMAKGVTPEIEDEFLAEVMGEEVGGEVVLDDPARADYQIQKISRLKKKQDEITALVTFQMGRLQTFHQERLAIIQGQIDWLQCPLELYVRDANRRNPKIKTIDLPNGKLKLQAQQDKFSYEEEKIFGWLEQKGLEDPSFKAEQFVEVKRAIRKNEIKEFVKGTGEIPDGVSIEPAGEPVFHLEIKGEEKGGGKDGE